MVKWCKVAYGPDNQQQGGDSEMLAKCEKKAQVIHTTTSMVGCTQYKNGQSDACDCGKNPKSKYYDDEDEEVEEDENGKKHDEF